MNIFAMIKIYFVHIYIITDWYGNLYVVMVVTRKLKVYWNTCCNVCNESRKFWCSWMLIFRDATFKNFGVDVMTHPHLHLLRLFGFSKNQHTTFVLFLGEYTPYTFGEWKHSTKMGVPTGLLFSLSRLLLFSMRGPYLLLQVKNLRNIFFIWWYLLSTSSL